MTTPTQPSTDTIDASIGDGDATMLSDAPVTAGPAHHAGRNNRGRWVGVPKKGDPRLPFAALMTLYAVTGTFFFSFNRSPLQDLTIVASACLLDMAMHWLLRGRTLLFPLSAYISSVSIALILNYSHTLWLVLFPVYVTICSKYVITLRGRHAFNPSLLGVVASLTIAGSLISAAPAYQWGGWWYTSTFMLAAAVLLVVTKVNRSWLVFSFLIFYTIQVGIRAYVLRYHIPWDVMFVGSLTTPPFFLFSCFMLTDPATSPSSRRGQVGIAFAITVVDLYFHTRWSVFTFFYAAFVVALARFAWGHVQELRRAGGLRPRLREAWSPAFGTAVLAVALITVSGGVTWAKVIHPKVSIRDPGFHFTTIAAADSGVHVRLSGATLKAVDPRVAHIAKWMLSVGAGAFASDVDGDGKVDLLLTNPLAVPGDRIELYRNTTNAGGKLHFTRQRPDAFNRFAGDVRSEGLPSAGLWFDYDNDGDRDLFVEVAFGKSRLLRNDSTPGQIKLTDVTEQAHASEFANGATVNAIDYDRDGDLDLLVGKILADDLPGYARGDQHRLNIFDLPKAEYHGDRRMLKFMHASWDNAVNGGENVMLRNNGDGTFTRIRGRDLGMPETHYTISIGTADINRDGFTDLYLASDFGRDDLYINEGGKGFRRVQGHFNGSIGKDTYKGMDSTIADFDRNGWPDIYVSNVHEPLQAEGSLLWMNQGTGGGQTSEHDPRASAKRWPAPKLEDEATARRALNEDRFGWGGDAADFDNDGWLDLTQTNGMVGNRLDAKPGFVRGKDTCPDYWYVNHKLMQSGPSVHSYGDKWGDLRGRCIWADEAQRLYLNRFGTSKKLFVDVSQQAGMTARGEGRGTAIADFNGDGMLDMVLTRQQEPPVVLESRVTRAGRGRHWLGLLLSGNGNDCNADAVGSQVRVVRDGQPVQQQEVQLVNGFESQRGPAMHFGLGDERGTSVDVQVQWCGHGDWQTYEAPIDRVMPLDQAPGAARPS